MGVLEYAAKLWLKVNNLAVMSQSQLNHMADSLSLLKDDFDATGKNPGFNGNNYPNYEAQVNELERKYGGRAAWGCGIVQAAIDVRSSFTAGMGIQAVLSPIEKEGSGNAEIEYINKFISLNGLSGEKNVNWAVEAELEGKFLAKISWDESNKNVVARYIPWKTTSYRVETREDDYEEYTGVKYYVAGEEKNIKPEQFVYAKFGGRTHMVNDTPPKVGTVLTEIEALAKAMRDHREINHLFSFPTPVVTCEDGVDAAEVKTKINESNWKIGKLLVLGGAKYELVGPDIQGVDSIEKEIVACIKIISAATGLPVHFFGFTDLMSNRATADSLMEMVFASTAKERQVWLKFYTHLFQKVLEMSNLRNGTVFDVKSVVAEIPEDSQTKRRQIVDFWLELLDRKALSVKTLLENVPGVEAEQEMERIKDERKEEMLEIESQLAMERDTQPGEKRKMEKRLGRPGE